LDYFAKTQKKFFSKVSGYNFLLPCGSFI